MGEVRFDITTSLDGFIAGPNDGPDQGLGEGGEQLHQWVYDLASWREPHGLAGGVMNQDSEILEEAIKATGAVIVGRRMFDNAKGWGEEPPFHVPVFVVTHEAREDLVRSDTTFTFVSDGIESALAQARVAAGNEDVSIGGGADIAQQYLKAGFVDEIQIHVAPLVLGGGIRLFDQLGDAQIELEKTRVIDSPAVTHLRFRVVR